MSKSFNFFCIFKHKQKKQFFQIQILAAGKINPHEITETGPSAKINPRKKIDFASTKMSPRKN